MYSFIAQDTDIKLSSLYVLLGDSIHVHLFVDKGNSLDEPLLIFNNGRQGDTAASLIGKGLDDKGNFQAPWEPYAVLFIKRMEIGDAYPVKT
jgi:hypothetical protein